MQNCTVSYLDWSQPFIDQITHFLLSNHTCEDEPFADLSHTALIMPSERSARELLKNLSIKVSKKQALLMPPAIKSSQSYVSDLILDNIPEIGELQLLSQMEELCFLLQAAQEVRTDFNFNQALSFTKQLQTLRYELSCACLSLSEALAMMECEQMPESQVALWQSFIEVEENFYLIISTHQKTDKIKVLEQLCQQDGLYATVPEISTVLLAGIVHPEPLTLKLLSILQLDTQILIYADENKSSLFNEYGKLLTESWEKELCPLQDRQIFITPESFEQGLALRQWLEPFANKLKPQSVAVATCDPLVAPALELELSLTGISSNSSLSSSLNSSNVGEFLLYLGEFVNNPSQHFFEMMITHPVFAQLLSKEENADLIRILQEWQEFTTTCLPNSISLHDDKFIEQLEAFPTLSQVALFIKSRLLPLPDSGGIQTARSVTTELLHTCPAKDTTQLETLRTLEEVLEALDTAGDTELNFYSIIQICTHVLKNKNKSEEADPDAQVEMMGWMDFAMDRSPIAALVSANDKFLPEKSTNESHLPDSTRALLGLMDSRFRFARDLYWLTTSYHSKKNLLVLASKRDTQGEEQLLSRILLQTNPESLAQRTVNFFTRAYIPDYSRQPGSLTPYMMAALPEKELPITSVSATGLQLYKACPYRFYLRYVLGVEDKQLKYSELDPLNFGIIAHDILRILSDAEMKNPTIDADDLIEHINQELQQLEESRFGPWTYPAVSVQLNNLRTRIASYVEQQLQLRQEGWTVVATEQRVKGFLSTENGKSRLPLVGQVDRIDYNRALNELRIYDFKTSEMPSTPENYHQKKSEWVRFQLPAYHSLVANSEAVEHLQYKQISLALFNLPRDISKTGISVASWDSKDLLIAKNEIIELVKKIADREFFSVSTKDLGYSWACTPRPEQLSDVSIEPQQKAAGNQ